MDFCERSDGWRDECRVYGGVRCQLKGGQGLLFAWRMVMGTREPAATGAGSDEAIFKA